MAMKLILNTWLMLQRVELVCSYSKVKYCTIN